MKYNTVKYYIDENKFVIIENDKDRVERETKPILNFYHYPITMKKEKAVERLRNYLIDVNQKIIKDLQDDIEKIKKAKCIK